MANKQINDLQLRSDFDATCNIPVDDASQTWRATGAQLKTYIQTAIAPLTTLGDILYAAAAGAPTRLAGNTTTARKVLAQTGDGSNSAAPAWTAPWAPNLAVAAKTANYNAASTDDYITVDATSAAFTITLPAAASNSGKVFIIKRIDGTLANPVTVDGNASETIDGETTTTLDTLNECIEIVCDGSNWGITRRYIPSVWTSMSMTIGATTTPPTKGTVSLDSARWKRNGANMEFAYDYRQTASGSAGSGNYLFPIPSGLAIDTTFQNCGSDGRYTLGPATVSNNADSNSAETYPGRVVAYSTTNVAIRFQNDSGSNIVDSQGYQASGNGAQLGATNCTITFRYSVPISGWKG